MSPPVDDSDTPTVCRWARRRAATVAASSARRSGTAGGEDGGAGGGGARGETCGPRRRRGDRGDNDRVRTFDAKFGQRFLEGVPRCPGVYRIYDESGALLYVGKAADLRRRLAQYRTTRRTKHARKRRALVRSAARIEGDVAESAMAASLREVRLIQELAPRENVASAFPFMYPFVGTLVEGGEVFFCLTTSPEAFPAFTFHGAFRSRAVTREAFFSLRRLLAFVGHPVPRHRSERLGRPRHPPPLGGRPLPRARPAAWD